MSSYSDVLSKELKSTTLDKSFVRANEPPLKKDEVSLHSTFEKELVLIIIYNIFFCNDIPDLFFGVFIEYGHSL